MPYTLALRDIEWERQEFELSFLRKLQLDDEEYQLAQEGIAKFGLASPILFDALASAENKQSFLKQFPHTVRLLSTLYNRSGILML